MKEMFETMPDLEQYPVPVLLTDQNFVLKKRNRRAEKLLPPPWRLRRLLEQMKKEKEERRWHLATLDGISYLVGLIPWEDFFAVVFAESLFPLQESLLRHFLGEGLDVLENYTLAMEGDAEFRENAELMERVTTRTFRLREEMHAYHWYLSLSRRKWKEPTVLDLRKFLEGFFVKLKEMRVFAALSCPDAAVQISPDVLAALVLNLVQFITVYEGVFTPVVSAEIKERRLHLRFSFDDREHVFSAMANLFRKDGDFSDFSAAMGLVPLLSVIVLCRMNGVDLEMRQGEGVAHIVMTMPGSPADASFFLENNEIPDEAWFETWLREIFFSNKKI